MQLIKDIKAYFFQKGMSKRQSSGGLDSTFMPFSKIKSIALIFDAKIPDNNKTALHFKKSLTKEGKKITLLGFYRIEKEETQTFDFPFFTEKDLDWFGQPLKGAAQTFSQRKFDLLVNMSIDLNPQLEYLSAITNARFKAGSNAGSIENYDLMLDISKNPNPSFLLDKIFSLLKNTIQ